MKKIVSFALAAFLTVGLCGTVAHAEGRNDLGETKIHVEDSDVNKVHVEGINVLTIDTTESKDLCRVNKDKAYEQICKLDERIQQKIDQASMKANHLIDKFKGDVEKLEKDENGAYLHPEQYDELAQKLDNDIEDIIEDLVWDTENIVRKIEKIAAENNIKIVNEYILVKIGDQYILIDPIRVIGE